MSTSSPSSTTTLPHDVYIFDKQSQTFVPLKPDYSNRVPLVSAEGVAAARGFRELKGAKSDKTLGIIVPLTKRRPNGAEWAQLATISRKYPRVHTIAVINPTLDRRGVGVEGPGPDAEYLNGIRFLQANGITVIGYIATGAGTKPFDDVKREIDRWKDWYPDIQGVFFDEMPVLLSSLDYYKRLDDYAKKNKQMILTVGDMAHGHVVGEPMNSDAFFHNTGIDIFVVYEARGYPTEAWYAAYKKPWVQDYPRSRFAWLAYGVADNDVLAANNFIDKVTGIERLGGYVFVQPELGVPDDQRGFSDWDTLSPYLETVLIALDRQAHQERIPFIRGVVPDTQKIEESTQPPLVPQGPPEESGDVRKGMVDNYGIGMIYPTKTSNGFEWHSETLRDLLNDSMVRNLPKTVRKKQDDKLTYETEATDKESKQIQIWAGEKRYISDIEATGYFKFRKPITKNDNLLAIHARTGRKQFENKKEMKKERMCEASGYIGILSKDGSVHAQKQINAEALTGKRAITQATTAPLEDRWIGIKFILFNYPIYQQPIGKETQAVHIEFQVDDNVTDDSGNLAIKSPPGWKRITATSDQGGWFATTIKPPKQQSTKKEKSELTIDKCPSLNVDRQGEKGRNLDEIISAPGGNESEGNAVIFELPGDCVTEFRFLSVREIFAPDRD